MKLKVMGEHMNKGPELLTLRTTSMIPISSSAWVVKPVMVLPATTDLPVASSMTPGKIASPWQLEGRVSTIIQQKSQDREV